LIKECDNGRLGQEGKSFFASTLQGKGSMP